MGAQDNTEKVLRSLHVLLSKSEPYPKEPSKVIIDKQQVIDLLAELNTCIYQIMDEYELTIRSRDKAERDFHKKGDQIIWDASRKAEDIYAASVMYMDETLNRMQDIMQEADYYLRLFIFPVHFNTFLHLLTFYLLFLQNTLLINTLLFQLLQIAYTQYNILHHGHNFVVKKRK